MNDFETRARAAGRAVRDLGESPVAETSSAPPARRGPTRAVLVAAAVVTVAAVVGTTLVTRDEGAGPASDVTTFCARTMVVVSTPVDRVNGAAQSEEPSLGFLRDAPEEIRPEALALLDARERGRDAPAEVARRFLGWWQLRCFPDAAMPDAAVADRRYAPVPAPAAFAPCGASNGTGYGAGVGPTDTVGAITVYGDPAVADPYAGPMIGVVRTDEQVFYRDDHAAPIAVPGHPDAEVIDATGTWGASVAGLGQAVTWKDDRGVVTVIGRGWTRDQAPELASIAATVTDGPRGPVLADPGRRQVLYAGPVADIYVRDVWNLATPTFTATYRVAGAPAAVLSGTVAGPAAVEATRFFAPELRREDAAGVDVVTGDLTATNSQPGTVMRIAVWNTDGVTLTLRWVDSSGALPSAVPFTGFAAATRRLDRAEWERLVGAPDSCQFSESSSASGSESSSETSTTTLVSP